MGYHVRGIINQRGTFSRGLETSVQSLVPERLEEDVNLLHFLLHLGIFTRWGGGDARILDLRLTA
jgi:hypothetical protein